MDKKQIEIREKLIELGFLEDTAEILADAFHQGFLCEVRDNSKVYFMGTNLDYSYGAYKDLKTQ